MLDALPLTANGKLDRRGPARPRVRGRPPAGPRPPPHEELLCAAVRRGARPGRGRRRRQLLRPRRALAARHPAGLAGSGPRSAPSSRSAALFEAPDRGRPGGRLAERRHRPRPPAAAGRGAARRGCRCPSRSAGSGSSHQLEGPSATYNMPLAVRLTGDARRARAGRRAAATWSAGTSRLRTVFPGRDGEPYQRILRPGRGSNWRAGGVEAGPGGLPGAGRAGARGTRSTWRPSVPIRASAVRRRPGRARPAAGGAPHRRRRLVDGRRWPGTWRTAYAARSGGAAPAWAPLPVQYADYTLWQRELLGDDADPDSLLARQLAYWRRALAGAPGGARRCPPTGRGRRWPATAGHRAPLRLPAELHQRLAELARAEGVTPVHGGAGGARGAAVPAGRGHRHPDRHARGRAAPTRPSTTWSGSSSTPWCSAPTSPATRTFRRAAGPGAGDRLDALGASGRAVRAAGRGARAGAVAGPAPAVPGVMTLHNDRMTTGPSKPEPDRRMTDSRATVAVRCSTST